MTSSQNFSRDTTSTATDCCVDCYVFNNEVSRDMKECLFIGPENSGKTLLIRKIKHAINNDNNNDEMMIHDDTMPTVGVDINTITLNENSKIILREVGGTMISRWSSFIETCDILIFVIDISNMSSLSTSLVLLMEMFTIILRSKRVQNIAISINKTDLSDSSSQKIAKNILSIDELVKEGRRNGINIKILEGNSIDISLALQCISFINEYLVHSI
jgi:signal recognition particle receptor subunit beta